MARWSALIANEFRLRRSERQKIILGPFGAFGAFGALGAFRGFPVDFHGFLLRRLPRRFLLLRAIARDVTMNESVPFGDDLGEESDVALVLDGSQKLEAMQLWLWLCRWKLD